MFPLFIHDVVSVNISLTCVFLFNLDANNPKGKPIRQTNVLPIYF